MRFSDKIKIFLLILPLACILFGYFLFKTDPLVVIKPASGLDKKHFRTSFFIDSLSGGNSSIIISDKPANSLSYSYVLNNKVNPPVVRLMIEPIGKDFIDLSHYNKLSITLRSDKGKKIPVIICNPIDFYSRPSEMNTYHLLINYIDAGKHMKTVELMLGDFTTPDWWYAYASNHQYQNFRSDVKLVKYIILSNSAFSGNINSDSVIITDMRFEYDFTGFVLCSLLMLFIYYSAYILCFHFPGWLGVEKIYLLYKKIDTVNYEDADKDNVFTYLQASFQHPDLTVSDVQIATGIHERKISFIIKKYTQTSFKQYINRLRIEKAKALLTSTNLSISDIAYECGYSNVSHFNRVFKTQQEVSPQEFRLDKTNNIS